LQIHESRLPSRTRSVEAWVGIDLEVK